jgi:NADPH-dependent glutamate synthase beta subunit-like oxidoreductase
MRMLDAVELLHDVAAGDTPLLGRRVAVYGGGDTAMDAARTAKRLGAADTVVVYRRDREHMPAHEIEVREAQEEAVAIRWLSTIRAAEEGRLVVERMALDADGFPQPTGELDELPADAVVLALGQEADLSLLDGLPDVAVSGGVIAVGHDHATGHPGVFAGGDAVKAQRTATTAVGHGRRAAERIDGYLRGVAVCDPVNEEPATFDLLNTWYYEDAPHQVRPRLEPARRTGTFDEVVHGLSLEDAVFEARRCMSCGDCFACDNCFGVCPDASVIKLVDGEYAIDLDHCKGCGLCAAECPCGAIVMIEEPA